MLHSKHEMLFSLFPSEENNTPIKSVDANGYRIVFYNFLPGLGHFLAPVNIVEYN